MILELTSVRIDVIVSSFNKRSNNHIVVPGFSVIFAEIIADRKVRAVTAKCRLPQYEGLQFLE